MVVEDCDLVVGESRECEGTLNGHVYDLRLSAKALTATEVAVARKVRLACRGRLHCTPLYSIIKVSFWQVF